MSEDPKLNEDLLEYKNEKTLKDYILKVETELEKMKKQLFRLRLYKLLGITENQLSTLGVSNLEMMVYDDEWSISYNHYTNKYDENNYNYADDSDAETEPREKNTNICFGETDKLFLRGKGIRMTRFKLYRNSRNELRIINKDYNLELDTESQQELIGNYSRNKHIPEWLALRIFLYMCEHAWESENLIQYLGIV